MSTPVSLYEIFPFCAGNNRLSADYSGAKVNSVVVSSDKSAMSLTITFEKPTPPYEISALESVIAAEYGLSTISISALSPRTPLHDAAGQPHSDSAHNTNTSSTVSAGKVIMGRHTKAKPTPMGQVTIDDGKVTICGEVCSVSSRFIEKSKSWILSFDITDYTGTLHVSKYMKEENASKIVNSIKPGMYLKVTGSTDIHKYTNDLVIDPSNIIFTEYASTRQDTAEEKRVELHLHTKMSALDAVTDTTEVIKRAIEWGHPAIAITDHGVVHSFPEAARAAGDKIKVIYGVEAYFNNDVDSVLGGSKPKKNPRNLHIILLAKNRTGLKNLYKLVTHSHLTDFHRHPVVKKSVLLEHREGLIIGSACEAGELFSALVQEKSREELEQIAQFYDYLEIQPVCNNMFMLYVNKPRVNDIDGLRDYNRRIYELGKSLDKPVIATGDVHFLDPRHEIFRHILLTTKNFEGAREDLPIYFKTTDELLDEFAYLGEEAAYETVISNTRKIADMCENISPLPPKNTLFAPVLSDSAEQLNQLVCSKLKELYGDSPPEIVTARLEAELGDILKAKYDIIYMAAQKLVAESVRNGYLVGSRGSVGSSFVAFLADITEVNALPAHYRCPNCRHSDFDSVSGLNCGADLPDMNCPICGTEYYKDGFNIPFETFLGFDGDKVPDIDLNFSGEFQAKAHKFTMELFGPQNVFKSGTIGTLKDKTAYGFVRKYLETIGKTTTNAEINRLSRGLVGVKRTTGQHPGGLVVIPQDMEITDFCPAQHPADSSDAGIITTHFEYKHLEDNLIKLDELGHDDPTMIKMLGDLTGINAVEISLDDPDTMAIFSSPVSLGLPENDDIIGPTGTIGIPEFGTGFTRQMLADTKPKDLDTLIRLSGFSHGTDVWLGNAKDLILTGQATVSETISCRDDIMLYLISKGMDDRFAFSVSENVRKGKGLPNGAEAEMTRLGIPGWYIISCNKIKYLFPRAHAVAYVMMAFRIAWFKAHRPLEFYSAYFYRRSQKDGFDAACMTQGINTVRAKIKQIKESKESKGNSEIKGKDGDLLTTLEACYEFYLRGFDFCGIDIYDSHPTHFLIENEKTLRPPLIAVSGLGETVAFDIAQNRGANGEHPFISIDEISDACVKLTKANLQQLKTLGALRDIPQSSQLSFF